MGSAYQIAAMASNAVAPVIEAAQVPYRKCATSTSESIIAIASAVIPAIVIMVPLLTLLSVNLGILISTRVNDVRVAQQIGGLVVVPVVGIGILQVTGRVVLNNESFLGTAVFLLVCDALVFFLARLAFQRENILSRWR
jgi:hypothetical protein